MNGGGMNPALRVIQFILWLPTCAEQDAPQTVCSQRLQPRCQMHRHFESPVRYHSATCSNKSWRILRAESGMTVPGPKMAAAPS